jgi:hypothetical protein
VRVFWPPAEAAQVDYEALRVEALAGCALADVAAARFAQGGMAALIARPVAEAVFAAVVRGASRPPWTPYADPRLEALAAGYRLLLDSANNQLQKQQLEVAR